MATKGRIRGSEVGRAAGAPRRADSPRLRILLALLALASLTLIVSRDWRRQLLEETARYRQMGVAAERSRSESAALWAQERRVAAAVRARPEDLDGRFQLAQLRWSLIGPPSAIPILEAWPVHRPDARALRMLAECCRLVAREDRTLQLLDRAAALFPHYSEVHADRALFFSRLGWMPEASAALRAMERTGAATEHVALVRAALARESADFRTARRLLEAAHRRQPGDPDILKQLAAVMNDEGEPERAVSLLRQSGPLKSDPVAALLVARIRVQQATPRTRQEALLALEQARAIRPLERGELLLQARCLRLSGRSEEARSILERLYRQAPHLPGLAFELGQICRAMPQLGCPRDPTWLFAQHQRERSQETELSRALLVLRNRSADPAAHQKVGLLYLRRRLYGRAVLELGRAWRMDPRASTTRRAWKQAQQALPRTAVPPREYEEPAPQYVGTTGRSEP